MADAIKDLEEAVHLVRACMILQDVQDEHRRHSVEVLVSIDEAEIIRQAVCSIDPLMEPNVRGSSKVERGKIYLLDKSLLERNPWGPLRPVLGTEG